MPGYMYSVMFTSNILGTRRFPTSMSESIFLSLGLLPI